jgi:hypothetical protein
MTSGSSTVVEYLTHNLEIEGSSLATNIKIEKMAKKPEPVFLVVCDPSMNEL